MAYQIWGLFFAQSYSYLMAWLAFMAYQPLLVIQYQILFLYKYWIYDFKHIL